MEGLHLLKQLVQNKDYMIKIDLKDAYFSVPMSKQHRRFLMFTWGEELYQFTCLPFGLAPAPLLFTKLLKPVVSLLRRLGLRMIIYLDDIIVLNQTQEGILRDRDSVLWLLQNLGFVINWEKSVLQPSHTMEYLGFVINSLELKLSLPETKMNHLVQSCRDLIQQQVSSVRTIAKVIGKLTSSMQAVFPAPLHYRHLQRLQINGLLTGKSYETMASLDQNCRNDLQCWIDQISIWNGRAIIAPAPDLVITTDASMRGWGAVCQGVHTRGLWTPQAATSLHINALELKAAFCAVRAFIAKKTQLHVHLRMDNKTAITYILKMGGTRSPILLRIAQELWDYALQNQISLTAEYLLGESNHEADWESRHYQDPSDWKLNPHVFQTLNTQWGPLEIDLFANRLNTQMKSFVSWFPDPFATATDAFQIPWSDLKGYCFPPFSLICRCLAKVRKNMATIVMVTPAWPRQAWYPVLLEMSCRQPILLPPLKDLLTSPRQQVHPLAQQGSLQLAAWMVSGKPYLQKEFQNKLPSYLAPTPGAKALQPLTIVPGHSGVTGVLKDKLIHFAPLCPL
ncbi:reverse transcriptase [Paramuricea clavata]|uniref:Reverse transcriptase n=1 Tax=Paramuricea clavata TaxID=317549 RepID=A0A7D9HV53_PARCT|nr:reverse transcriptase [Paramuricea clavata]